MHDEKCGCLRCQLSVAFNKWIDVQPDHTVDQKEVTQKLVEFLGDVLQEMPAFNNIRPLRITITGYEADEAPPRLN